MKLEDLYSAPENEKPLDNIITHGGLCPVLRTLGCIGDSLSSGEFEALDDNGNRTYHDMYEYSWGQNIARNCGIKVYNFSKGGMTAKEYTERFAQEKGFWGNNLLCNAYIIALGVNDIVNQRQTLGSLDDINAGDYEKNADTFAGYYAKIIQRLKSMQPEARFFLMTMPKDGSSEADSRRLAHRNLLHDMTEYFTNTYLLDLYTYAPVYDKTLRERLFFGGHMSPAGYVATARMTESYLDYIIRHNYEDFKQMGFIGTPYYR